MFATSGSVVADGIGWGHMNGWGWSAMIVGWLLVIGLVAFVAWLFVDRRADKPGQGQAALDVLETRFARGEITADEYRERRDILLQSQERKGK